MRTDSVKKRRTMLQSLAAVPHAVWCAIFILAPLVFVVYYTLTDKDGHFTLANLAGLASQTFLSTFGKSVLYSLLATLICLVIAYPLAYFLSKMKPHHQQLLVMLLMLPMWTSFLIRTFTLMQLLENNGTINTLLMKLGAQPVRFLGTGGAVVLGMVYNYLPYMVLPIYSVLSKLDPRLIEASYDLGATPARTMVKVVFPLSLSGVISGITMVFVPSISTFYISKKMGGGMVLVGDVIETQFLTNYNYNMGAAMSLALMILVLISMWVMNRFGDRDAEVLA